MYQCKGDGSCLKEIDENQYEKNDEFICVHNCQPIMCPNYKLCKNLLKKCWEDCHDELCGECYFTFGKCPLHPLIGLQSGKGRLNFIDNIECPICLEYKEGVSYPRCDHYACIQCFQRCFYGDFSNEPEFPYPELENEYFENEEDLRWNEFPKILEWKEHWKNWNIETTNRRNNDLDTLEKCPLCRS